jgi:hypothetical protein
LNASSQLAKLSLLRQGVVADAVVTASETATRAAAEPAVVRQRTALRLMVGLRAAAHVAENSDGRTYWSRRLALGQ